MRRNEIITGWTTTRELLRLIDKRLPELLDQLAQFDGTGWGAGDTNERVTGGQSGSVVERQLGRTDPARQALAATRRDLLDLHNAAARLYERQASWLSRPSTKGAAGGEPGCEVMAKVGVWEPGTITNAGGNLSRQMRLGRWARDFVKRNGRLPTRAEADARAQGRKPRVRKAA